MATKLREEILRLIESDKEFRYTLMGLLGFREILDRITRLEERQQKLEERFAELEARFVKLEERFAQLEERMVRLEERFAKLEDRYQRLEERVARLEERMLRVEEELRDLRRVVTAIAHRFGVISEKAFREAMKYVVEDVLGVAKVERWVYRDEEGFVYGYPSVVEVDVVVRDREHILVEVKSRVSRGDVAELYRKGLLYEKVRGVRPKLMIIGGFVDPSAYEASAKLGVEIRPIVEE